MVLPDQVTINDSFISARATDVQTGERVILAYFAKNYQEVQKISKTSSVMRWTVSGNKCPLEPALILINSIHNAIIGSFIFIIRLNASNYES